MQLGGGTAVTTTWPWRSSIVALKSEAVVAGKGESEYHA